MHDNLRVLIGAALVLAAFLLVVDPSHGLPPQPTQISQPQPASTTATAENSTPMGDHVLPRRFSIDYKSGRPVISAAFFADDSPSALPAIALTIYPGGEVVLVVGEEMIGSGTFTAHVEPKELREVVGEFLELGLLDRRFSSTSQDHLIISGHGSTMTLDIHLDIYEANDLQETNVTRSLQLRPAPVSLDQLPQNSEEYIVKSAANLVWRIADGLFFGATNAQ